MDKNKRIYLSKDNKMLLGVCGGIGEYFEIDPTLVRIGFLIFANVMIFPYVIMYVIIPNKPY